MKTCTLLLLLLLSLVNNNAFAQGTNILTYGYQPYYAAPAPLVYSQPVIATGYYAVPVTTYQYVPYQYVAGYSVFYPGNWTNVISGPVIVDRGGCFASRRHFNNYSNYYYYR